MDQVLQRLLDFRYVDFRDRHVFTTKVRLLIFIGYWVLIAGFFPDLLWADQPIMLLISLTFTVTTVCYYFIFQGKLPYLLFIIELATDVAAHTILIYVTGGVASKLYMLYILYCLAGGLIYNWRVSAVIAFLALFFYSSLLASLQGGWLAPFAYQGIRVAWLGHPDFQWLLNLVILVASLVVAVYGNSIATYFNQLRERAIEARNRELIALNRVASTIRSILTFQRVVDEIVHSLTRSFGYSGAVILIVSEEQEKVRFYSEERGLTQSVNARLGFSLTDAYLPINDEKNPVYQAMKKHQRILRSNLSDIVMGIVPRISADTAHQIQDEFGFHKTIAVPLIAEHRLVGALVGLSPKEWLSDDDIASFEHFADQAALVLDNAALIEKLKSKNVALERVSRVKSEFLATMSHELRTPLTAIIGFSELLLEEVLGDLSSDQKDSLSEVLTNAENLLHLINSLLDLAKIEAGKMELTIVPLSLGEILERIERTVAVLLRKKGHRMEVHVQEGLPTFYGDEKKIQQTLLNLASNAIKFTKEGGSIKIEVRYYSDLAGISRWSDVDPKEFRDGAFELLVSDSGIGIAEKDLEKIFESFSQVDSSITRSYQGTGLGLALSQQFIAMHHGQIKVESCYGKGSTFYVLLPKGDIPDP